MTRTMLVLLTSATLVACSTNSSSTSNADPDALKTSVASSVAGGHQLTLPTLSTASMPKLRSGSIMLTGDTGVGTATFAHAPRFDYDAPNPTFGDGTFAIHVGNDTYSATTVASVFDIAEDETGTSYLLVGAMSESPTRFEVVYTVVKASDLAGGASIALDGVDRWALYVAGPIDSDDPDTVAVATTGTVTFGPTATSAGPLDATLDATFQRAEVTPEPTQPPSDGGTEPVDPPRAPTAGAYTLQTADVRVDCTGALVGKEADFAALNAASGFQGLGVQLAVSGSQVTLSGAGFSEWFGVNPIVFEPTEGVWQSVNGLTGGAAGPDGTTRWGGMVALDAASNVAQVALVYQGGDQNSYCGISFTARLN